jgi:F0F1-type ATP synthase membrane subunit c/vacuolar-type H+-ATPase subunit K
MTQLSRLVFGLAVCVAALVIVVTTLELPTHVASHFGAGNVANDSMDRLSYLVLMLGLAVGLPVLLVVAFSRMPRALERKLNIPHRDYWLAPARRQRTLAFLGAHVCWLGTLLAAFLTGIHFVLVAANTAQPPRLPAQPFVTLLVLFFCAMALWVFALVARFRIRDRGRA